MYNVFREVRRETQKNYGGYCNFVRQRNIEPVPYHVFADKLHHLHKTEWVKVTIQLHNTK